MAKKQRDNIDLEFAIHQFKELMSADPRHKNLKNSLILVIHPLYALIHDRVISQDLADKILNPLLSLAESIANDDQQGILQYASLYYQGYKELLNSREVQLHLRNRNIKILLEHLKDLNQAVHATASQIDGSFTFASQEEQRFQFYLSNRIGILAVMLQQANNRVHRHFIVHLHDATSLLLETSRKGKVDHTKINAIADKLHNLHNVILRVEMHAEFKPQAIKNAINKYNSFVKTQTATMIGKQLLFALKAVGAAALSVFTFTVEHGNAKRIYKDAKHEAKLHRDLTKRMSLFKPAKKTRRPQGEAEQIPRGKRARE